VLCPCFAVDRLELATSECAMKLRRELGEKFDLKAFHDEILNGGAMPLDLLQERVEAWIKDQAAQPNKRKPESERQIGCSFSSITFRSPHRKPLLTRRSPATAGRRRLRCMSDSRNDIEVSGRRVLWILLFRNN